MKITGIIAEFNPFHNGHNYLISQARELTGCDFVVVAMSGDFVQRGAPAIVDKGLRTKEALLHGADMVIQLPVIASTSSASIFALSGVASLAACGVSTLVFGCEENQISLFSNIATILNNEPEEYKKHLSSALKTGLSFPAARSQALSLFLSEDDSFIQDFSTEELSSILESPNNILAIEYIRAIKQLNVSMDCYGVKRMMVEHHGQEAKENFASATLIRSRILHSNDFPSQCIPNTTGIALKNYLNNFAPVDENSFTEALRYKLLLEKGNDLARFMDGSSTLANRIYTNFERLTSVSDFALFLNTKDSTYTRLMRYLTHILLHITSEDLETFSQSYLPFVRVLGFKRNSSALLAFAKNNAITLDIPFITSVNEFESKEKGHPSYGYAMRFLSQDIFARELYRTTVNFKKTADSTLKSDYQQPLIII